MRSSTTAVLVPLLTLSLVDPCHLAGRRRGTGPLASSIAVDWQRTPLAHDLRRAGHGAALGALYLSFTSLAMYQAAGEVSGTEPAEAAAVAIAAHDVLVEYFPASTAALDADLATSLAAIPDGTAERQGQQAGAGSPTG